RTSTCSPTRNRHNQFVTLPTARTVWASRWPSASGEPLMLMAASAAPQAYSMLNCPGWKLNGRSLDSSSVHTSGVSRTTRSTRHGMGSKYGVDTLLASFPVHVCLLEAHPLESTVHFEQQPTRERVRKGEVLLNLRA